MTRVTVRLTEPASWVAGAGVTSPDDTGAPPSETWVLAEAGAIAGETAVRAPETGMVAVAAEALAAGTALVAELATLPVAEAVAASTPPLTGLACRPLVPPAADCPPELFVASPGLAAFDSAAWDEGAEGGGDSPAVGETCAATAVCALVTTPCTPATTLAADPAGLVTGLVWGAAGWPPATALVTVETAPETGFPETGFPETGFPEPGFPEAGLPEIGEVTSAGAGRSSFVAA
jgi:hypothetical protein